MGYAGARGTLIYEKNLKAKISCQTPFNYISMISAVSEWILSVFWAKGEELIFF